MRIFQILGLASALLVPTFATSTMALAETTNTTPMITIQGSGKISARPDLARFSTGVVTESKSANAAMEANIAAMKAALAALHEAGIGEEDIITSGINVAPRYTYPNKVNKLKTATLTGYTVSNRISVTIRDVSTLGRVLDTVLKAGVTQIDNLRFDVSNKSELLDKARASAFKDAERKAKAYADAAGLSLDRILTIQEGAASSGPRPVMARAALAEDGSVPVATGNKSYAISVTVSWAMK